MAVLKPCPFCGGTNLQLRVRPPFVAEIHCEGCMIDVVIKEDQLKGNWAQQAITIWNRREERGQDS